MFEKKKKTLQIVFEVIVFIYRVIVEVGNLGGLYFFFFEKLLER